VRILLFCIRLRRRRQRRQQRQRCGSGGGGGDGGGRPLMQRAVAGAKSKTHQFSPAKPFRIIKRVNDPQETKHRFGQAEKKYKRWKTLSGAENTRAVQYIYLYTYMYNIYI